MVWPEFGVLYRLLNIFHTHTRTHTPPFPPPPTHNFNTEMRPQWFEHPDIPFPTMWPDDHLWFPYLLSKRYFDAFFKFEGHDKILEYTITEKHH